MEGSNDVGGSVRRNGGEKISASSDASESLPLPERLRSKLEFWKTFTTDKLVLNILKEGYKLKWKEGPMPENWTKGKKKWKTGPPPKCHRPNTAMCDKYEGFVDGAVLSLDDNGVVGEIPREKAHCILSLSVDDKRGEEKLRLVLNGRPVNLHEATPSFKMETLHREGRDVFRDMAFGGCLDISSAYHNLSIHKDSQKYLCFEWKGKVYAFKALPFGISSAPAVWTMVSKEPIKVFRSNGVNVLHYMDDWGWGSPSAEKSLRDARFMIEFTRNCGFKLELEKKCKGWDVPLSRFELLGFELDLRNQMFYVPAKKVQKLMSSIANLRLAASINDNIVTAKSVAEVTGRIVSMSIALGGVSRMRTRCLYKSLGLRETAAQWREPCRLSKNALDELKFWEKHFDRFNGRRIAQAHPPRSVEMHVATDAGEKRVGGFVQLDENISKEAEQRCLKAVEGAESTRAVAEDVKSRLRSGVDVSYPLDEKQQKASSTWRELFGVLCILRCFIAFLAGFTVRLYVDNAGTAFCLGGKVQGTSKNGKVIDFTEKFHGGSTVEENQELVAQIVDLAVEHNVDLETQWIPREENVRADASTHISAVHDFKLRDEIFRRVDEKWGEHTIDRFACPGNVRVKSGFYNSRFLEPGMKDCRGIDALAQSDWGVHNNYVHPPYMLLAPTIYTIRRTGAKATLICPMWKGSVFWPLLRSEDGKRWASDIVEVMYLGMAVHPRDSESDVLIPVGETIRDQLPKGHIYALRFESADELYTSETRVYPTWQGKWWEARRKRARNEDQSQEYQKVNRRYRKEERK